MLLLYRIIIRYRDDKQYIMKIYLFILVILSVIAGFIIFVGGLIYIIFVNQIVTYLRLQYVFNLFKHILILLTYI
jgi:hypothetical protein